MPTTSPTSPVSGATSTAHPLPQDGMREARQCVSSPVVMVSDDADMAREAEIVRLSEAMQRAYAIYVAAGDFAALGDAHRLRLEMQALIHGRSAAQVARMEEQRGLR